jgi:hypothetical protein
MSVQLTEEEIEEIGSRIDALRLEHSDLDQVINHLSHDKAFEELKIKRLKKRRLKLKDQLVRLEGKLIPDFIA